MCGVAREPQFVAHQAMPEFVRLLRVREGRPLHYLRYDGERPGALPVILTNGWPSAFLELTGMSPNQPSNVIRTRHPIDLPDRSV